MSGDLFGTIDLFLLFFFTGGGGGGWRSRCFHRGDIAVQLSVDQRGRDVSKMVSSCLDIDKQDQNVSTAYSVCVCVCVCADYFTPKHETCCASLLQLVSTCKHCTVSIFHSAQVNAAIMLKAHLPDIFLPKMASRGGRSRIRRVLIGSLIDWWSPVIYWFISVPNELRVLSCPEENNRTLTQAL